MDERKMSAQVPRGELSGWLDAASASHVEFVPTRCFLRTQYYTPSFSEASKGNARTLAWSYITLGSTYISCVLDQVTFPICHMGP